jgi:serine protease Do
MAAVLANLSVPLAVEAAALVEALRQSVVRVNAAYGHGAGVIWTSDGLVVTNHHVVSRDYAEVELVDGRRLRATVVARDPENDLAALQLPAEDLSAAPVGDATALRVGELIVAVGHPFGVRGTATLGIVSAPVGPAWWGRRRRELLQADVDLAPGNSGGPLADVGGRVVGIASMVLAPGIAIAVPSHVVTRFVATIPETQPALLQPVAWWQPIPLHSRSGPDSPDSDPLL